MEIEDKFKVYIIRFNKFDFETGIAQEAIALIKSLPTGAKKYYNKQWTVTKDKMRPGFWQELTDLQYKPTGSPLEGKNDFDADAHLTKIFGYASLGKTVIKRTYRKDIDEYV